MKRKFALLLFLATMFFCTQVQAREWLLSLGSSSSGTTTAASGTSEMYVDYGSQYICGLGDYEDPVFVMQLKDVDSGLTVAQAYAASNSGVTFGIKYKEWIVNTANNRAYAPWTPLWTGMGFSGATNYAIRFKPEATGCIQFAFVSGVTPMGKADFILKVVENGRDSYKPIRLDYDEFGFGTSGTTKVYGGSASAVHSTCAQCIEAQAVGDSVHYTTDGSTTPTTSSKYIPEGSIIQLTKDEWDNFEFIPGGTSSGTLSATFWTECP